jgi:hypothetical protein
MPPSKFCGLENIEPARRLRRSKPKMRREIENIIAQIESQCHARPTAMEFEMAYQARIAIDRIRFAIKHTEQFAPHTDQMREAGLQLLDALERLEAVDRRFQRRSRLAPVTAGSDSSARSDLTERLDLHDNRRPHQPNGHAGEES